MEILGYILAVFIGISLGLIGGGGSILTVPVLVYLFHIEPTLATSYSLFIVGMTSLSGAIYQYSKGYVDLKAVLSFGLLSVVTVFAVRKYLLPLIPDILWQVGAIALTKSTAIMVLFAALMLAASISMVLGHREQAGDARTSLPVLSAFGIGIGLVTGLLGAGGGFLIIPALVLLAKTPMRVAIGTSLFIVTINSLVGFVGDIGHVYIDWPFLFTMLAITVCGVLIGSAIGRRIPGERLRAGFGWFVLTMGIYILSRELF
ncbi:MAG TPA: sulfite exporter TauE/SafE family protein [Parapedobacter sp.]|uniref:sulfite exporter TauE/SafE family protein n=1 Tax=Parapedobacter sp. TaxID=1958893 RepID=UPI002D1D4822|nr:sulfite exporter TauE/SafE family protein [Parapedobacter sp.]HWK59235.1 sulfite exporter TauE/SafE family protein [Parapedobacter sp.]